MSANFEAAFPAEGQGAPSNSLRLSKHLARVSTATAALTRELYGREPLCGAPDRAPWRFRWVPVSQVSAELLLRVRVGATELVVGIADSSSIVALQAVRHLELPRLLRVACMSALTAALSEEVAAVTGCEVELCDAQSGHSHHVYSPLNSGGRVDFSLELSPGATPIVGFVCATDDASRSLLCKLARDRLRRPHPVSDLPVPWSVVVGSSSLAARELKTLEPYDILLIENAVATPEALGCTLCLGGRPFGRAELRSGKLHVIEWNAQGESAMSSRTPDGDSHQEIAFAEIQVDLRFELAQWRTTLADVSGLAPGTILEVGHRIDDQSVSVFVEHRCVGKGQLVAIGERLGVRLSSVFGANAATADAATRAVDSGEAVV